MLSSFPNTPSFRKGLQQILFCILEYRLFITTYPCLLMLLHNKRKVGNVQPEVIANSWPVVFAAHME